VLRDAFDSLQQSRSQRRAVSKAASWLAESRGIVAATAERYAVGRRPQCATSGATKTTVSNEARRQAL